MGGLIGRLWAGLRRRWPRRFPCPAPRPGGEPDSAERRLTRIEATAQKDQIVERRKPIAEDLESARDRVESVRESGTLTETIGTMLRNQREALPEPRRFRQDTVERQEEIARATAAESRCERQLRDLTPIDERVQEIMQGLDPNLSEYIRRQLEGEVRKLLEDRRSILRKLHAGEDGSGGYADYWRTLVQLDIAQEELLSQARSRGCGSAPRRSPAGSGPSWSCPTRSSSPAGWSTGR